MGLFDKLFKSSRSKEPQKQSGSADPNGIIFYFRCSKCGTPVRVRVDRRNDLNSDEEGPGYYVVRKDVMDSKCFQMMRAEIWMDTLYNVVQADVRGGEMITEEEYKAAQTPKTGSQP